MKHSNDLKIQIEQMYDEYIQQTIPVLIKKETDCFKMNYNILAREILAELNPSIISFGDTDLTVKYCKKRNLSDVKRVVIYSCCTYELQVADHKAVRATYCNYNGQKIRRNIYPTMIIEFNSGKELFLTDVSCGYSGTGPHGALEICQMCGIPNDLLDSIFCSNILKIVLDKDGNTWQSKVIRDGNIKK